MHEVVSRMLRAGILTHSTHDWLDVFIVIWSAYEGSRPWLGISRLSSGRNIEKTSYQLLIFVDEERALESFSIFFEPLMLYALLSRRPLLRRDLDHLLDEVLALVTHTSHMHCHSGERIRVLISN